MSLWKSEIKKENPINYKNTHNNVAHMHQCEWDEKLSLWQEAAVKLHI